MDALVHRPVGDLLEEIVDRGPARSPDYLVHVPGAPPAFRLAVLLGALCLGPEVVEAVRERLIGRESAEKWALVRALAELAHPEAEGYLARLLRERPTLEASAAALRGLGRIRGPKSLPLVVRALEEPLLAAEACAALGGYATPDARQALLDRAEELPAFRELATLG
ncbi:MAG: HEAT repeat domain-containing protein, partial [Proteobacteria bacterium]|nr:HEAT repeat domain-containing protein [Pseudomonadota bacterium]